MPRPKKGEKGCEEATKKWRATMLKKYGSEEALHEAMSKMGHNGGIVSTPNGGFGSSKKDENGLTGPERARLAGAIGGAKSTRAGIKNGEGKTIRKKKTEKTTKTTKKTGLLKKIFGGK